MLEAAEGCPAVGNPELVPRAARRVPRDSELRASPSLSGSEPLLLCGCSLTSGPEAKINPSVAPGGAGAALAVPVQLPLPAAEPSPVLQFSFSPCSSFQFAVLIEHLFFFLSPISHLFLMPTADPIPLFHDHSLLLLEAFITCDEIQAN